MAEMLTGATRCKAGQVWRWLGLLCLLSFLGGCAQFVPQTISLREAWPPEVPRALELTSVPFFPQNEYQCGPAALATVMGSAGSKILPDNLVDEVYLPARRGSLQVEMLAAPRRHGLVPWQLPARYDALLRELAAGNPVLVLQDLGIWPVTNWHYAVVVGFDYETGMLYLRSGETERQMMPFTIFELTWKRGGYWAMVVNRPGSVPASATEASYLPAMMAFERTASPAASRDAWEAFLARWPGNAFASVALSNRYYAERRLPLAEFVLRQAAAKNADSAEILNNHAQVLSDMGHNDEALAVINRAAALNGNFAAEVADTRAGILRRLKPANASSEKPMPLNQ
ncbi:MAG: PA2778 family cysteine peptidase [Pseudomonadota bacterium]